MNVSMTGKERRMSAPSKENFFQSLTADTWCGWDWCRKLYGYSVTDPAFLERVFARLDELNRLRVKHIYAFYLKTQIAHEKEQEREAGEWLDKQINKNYERQVKETECQKKMKKNASNRAFQTVLGWM